VSAYRGKAVISNTQKVESGVTLITFPEIAFHVHLICVSVVLSSDDEENGDSSEHRSRVVRALVPEEDREVQGKPSLEAVSEEQEAPDRQGMQVGRKCTYLLHQNHVS